MIGQTFGYLTVIEDLGYRAKRKYVLCKCKCGNEVETRHDKVKGGHTRSCGCLQKEAARANAQNVLLKSDSINHVGEVYGYLTIVEMHERKNGRRTVLCKCKCGASKVIRYESLQTGNTRSCGCLFLETNGLKHGLHNHPLYRVWNQMKQRCLNHNDTSFERYGGRGIGVCDEWRDSYLSFYTWCIENGWQKGLQIDREDNSGNYDRSNCRFVTPTVNCRNKRTNLLLTYNGETKTFVEWCGTLGINAGTLKDRLFVNNWSIEDAFTLPVRKMKKSYVAQ